MLDEQADQGTQAEDVGGDVGDGAEFYLSFDDDDGEAPNATGGDADASAVDSIPEGDPVAVAPQASPAATAPVVVAAEQEPAYVTELRAQLAQANQRYDQLHNEFGPYLQGLRTQAQQQATRPPLTPEQIRSGQFTPEQFEQYMDWKVEQRLAAVQQQAVSATTYNSSQQAARARFTAEALGDANLAYDKLVADYFAPAYAQNPALQGAVATIIPDDPAAGEMLVGALLRLYHANGQDMVKTVRAMHGKAAATAKPATDPRRAAQQRQADKIVRQTGAGTGKRIDMNDPEAFDRMSDRDFERLLNQTGDGL